MDNVADVKSMVIYPVYTTHSQLSTEELLDQGIKPNTIRLLIGPEHTGDIMEDHSQACHLNGIKKQPYSGILLEDT